MKQRSAFTLLVGLVIVTVSVLGSVQWLARSRYLQRGMPRGFPEPIADTPGATGETMPRLCINAPLEDYSGRELAVAVDNIADGGFGWVRQQFSWSGAAPSPGEISWTALDAVVAAASDRALRLIAVLDDAPSWAGYPPDPDAYADWTGAVASRYGEHLTYYQVWHNPNLAEYWGGAVNPFEYAELLAQAAEAIRSADPDARIVLGSLAPTSEQGARNFADDLYLDMLYDAGAAPYFDVVAAQPYGFHTGPSDRRVSRNVLNFSRAILLRETMVRRDDGSKAIWAANFGWNSLRRCWPGAASIWGSVGEPDQALHTVAALNRAREEWPWLGVMCLTSYQPRPERGDSSPSDTLDAEEHWGFALLTPDGVPRPVYSAVRQWASDVAKAHTGVYRADTDLATFTGSWTLGPQGADIGEEGANRVTFPFVGTGVALTVRRGPYRAFLYVTVDGEPAPRLPRDRRGRAYLVLYDPLAETVTVPLADELVMGDHVVSVEAERGWGQWALADWRVTSAPASAARGGWGYAAFGALGLAGLGLIVAASRSGQPWALVETVRSAFTRLAGWLQLAISAVATVFALLATWQLLSGEAVFRRLGAHGDLVALMLAAGLFYFSPWALLSLAAGLAVTVLVLLRPALGLALAIAACPLYAYPLSLVGRSFALSELVLLPALVGWLVQWIGGCSQQCRDLSQRVPKAARALLRPLLLVLAVSLVSCITAQHMREALRELRLVVLEPTLLFIALVTLPMAPKDRRRVVDALIVSGSMVALVGLVMYARGAVITAEGGSRRLLSVYGSPNNVGLFLGRVLPVAVSVAIWGSRSYRDGASWTMLFPHGSSRGLLGSPRRLLYAVAIVPIVAAIGLSLSRGALVLGVPAALVAMGLLAGRRWRLATGILVFLGAVGLLLLLQTPRFAGMLDVTTGTTGFRLSLWRSSLAMFGDHPLLGVGPDNFLYAYRTRYVLPNAWEEFNLSHAHNVLLDFATRLGALGLGAFVWTQAVFWRQLLLIHREGHQPTVTIGLAGSMVNFLAHGLVDASYFVVDLAYVYVLSLAVLVWVSQNPEREEAP